MSKEFDKLMSAHEVSDKDYINSVEEVKARIIEEFQNADQFLSYLEKDERAAKAFFDYSGAKPYPLEVIPIRKSDKLYVKKHTATQRPYYHFHAFYELIFVQNGKCGFYSYPNGERYCIDKGSACIFAPGSVHAMARAGKKDVILKAVIPCEVFDEITGKQTVVKYGEIRIFENAGDKAQSYFQNFMRENSSDLPLARIAEKSWLSLCLVELFSEKHTERGDIVRKFYIYIADNLKTASMVGFCKFAGYNPDHITRVLKRETGKTFKENVTEIRLSEAKALLKTTDMSVESIANETGYLNPSGFYKQFTATFGITPAQYRRAHRQSEKDS